MLDSNIIFQGVLWACSAIFLLFIIAAGVVAYRRNTFKSYFEVLRSMFINPMFGAALVAGAMSVLVDKSMIAMVGAFVTFITYKAAATETILIKSGDNKYNFFNSDSMNKYASYVISTKTVVALIGIGAIWYAGFFGFFDPAGVEEQILALAGAWFAANGLGAITLLAKGKDLSFLNPIVQKTPQIELESPSAVAPIQSVTPPVNNVENNVMSKVEEKVVMPFDETVWGKEVEGYAARQNPEMPIKEGMLAAVGVVATKHICESVEQLIDFARWRVNLAYDAFFERFGFNYPDIEKNFNNLELLKCQVTDIDTFLMALPLGYKTVYLNVTKTIRGFEQFASDINRLGEDKVQAWLDRGWVSYSAGWQALRFVV